MTQDAAESCCCNKSVGTQASPEFCDSQTQTSSVGAADEVVEHMDIFKKEKIYGTNKKYPFLL